MKKGMILLVLLATLSFAGCTESSTSIGDSVDEAANEALLVTEDAEQGNAVEPEIETDSETKPETSTEETLLTNAPTEETKAESGLDADEETKETEMTLYNDDAQSDCHYFKTGLWEVIEGEDITGWYYFSEDGTKCSYHDEDGMGGVSMDYEMQDGTYVFHIGSADDNTHATVTFDGEEDAVIHWENGNSDKIRFVENTKYEDFDTTEGRGDVIDDSFAAQ